MLKKRKSKIYSIEINDEKINNEIGVLLFQTEKEVQSLIVAVRDEDILSKKKNHKELYALFYDIKQKTQTLKKDLDSIIDLELKKKEYIIIRDQNFIQDKLTQLSVMQANIDDLLSIIEEHPSAKSYKQDLIELVLRKLHSFIEAVKAIKNDDAALNRIYDSLSDI